jgi:UDP-glucose 4-epimerase
VTQLGGTATYAITGSSGYVGTCMTRWLLEREPDARVIGFDVRPPRVDSDRLEFHAMDVRDKALSEVLAGRGVKSLLHFAFVLDPMYDEQEMHDIDLGGTANVLTAVDRAKIPHLLATSSTTAYGALADNPVPLTEDAPTRATADFYYAHDKRLMDEMLRKFAAEHPAVKVCIVRPCIVLGPTVANYIVASMLSGSVTALLGGADPEMQFIHEDDLVRLIATCVEKQTAGVFNAVGAGTVTTTQTARMQGKRALKLPYKAVRAAVWCVQKLKLLDYSTPPGSLAFFRWSWVASGDKARRDLGFQPEHTSEQCFQLLVDRKSEVLANFKERMKSRAKR